MKDLLNNKTKESNLIVSQNEYHTSPRWKARSNASRCRLSIGICICGPLYDDSTLTASGAVDSTNSISSTRIKKSTFSRFFVFKD